MISALVPTWILGGAFIALLVLNGMFQSGSSSMSDSRQPLGPADERGRVAAGRTPLA
jgi:hypothetical protein